MHISNLQAGYPSPSEHARSYLFGSWDGKRDELAAKRHRLRLFFYIADFTKQNPVGGFRQNAGLAGVRQFASTMDIDFWSTEGLERIDVPRYLEFWQFGKNLGTDIGVLANSQRTGKRAWRSEWIRSGSTTSIFLKKIASSFG